MLCKTKATLNKYEDIKEEIGRETFSAAEFIENLMTNGEQVVCDETSPTFRRSDLPDYYDEELYQIGQKFFYKHIFGQFLGKFLGLISVLSQKSTLTILKMTNMSNSHFTAYRRYIATLFHIVIWYEDSFRPGSKLWKSLKVVKTMHNSASKRASKNLFYRISQKDMAVTQFGLMGFALIRGEMIGIHNPTKEELKGFIHIWRVVGYILGIEERFNICRDSVKETKEICNIMLERILRPAIKEKDPEFLEMSSYLTKGLWCTNPYLEHNVFMFYLDVLLDKDISQISSQNAQFNKLTKREQFKIKLIVRITNWMKYTIVRLILKYLQLYALWQTKIFPYLAVIRYGWKDSYVKVP